MIGDIGWCLVNDQGQQIEGQNGIRISQLLNWRDLNNPATTRPSKIMLVAAPCCGNTCEASKGPLLRTLLTPRDAKEATVITHLVTDLRSARELLGEQLAGRPGHP